MLHNSQQARPALCSTSKSSTVKQLLLFLGLSGLCCSRTCFSRAKGMRRVAAQGAALTYASVFCCRQIRTWHTVLMALRSAPATSSLLSDVMSGSGRRLPASVVTKWFWRQPSLTASCHLICSSGHSNCQQGAATCLPGNAGSSLLRWQQWPRNRSMGQLHSQVDGSHLVTPRHFICSISPKRMLRQELVPAVRWPTPAAPATCKQFP